MNGCLTVILILLGILLVVWVINNIGIALGIGLAIWGAYEWKVNRDLKVKSKMPAIIVAIGLVMTLSFAIASGSDLETETVTSDDPQLSDSIDENELANDKHGAIEEVNSDNNSDASDLKEDQTQKTKQEEKSHEELANPPPSGELVVHFIDVGQGDATLLHGPDFTILIDAGRHDRNDVVPYLQSIGIKNLDIVIGTHPHADHIGQIDKVLDTFNVTEVWFSGDAHTSKTFERVIDAIERTGVDYNEPRAGETYQVGSAIIEVINPDTLTGDLHEGCIALRVIYGDVTFLFTGDVEAPTEKEILNRGHDVNSQIFQLGHHGSSTSNTSDFLKAVNPDVAIYSAGKDNSYGHPHAEVVNRILDMGIELYGTDVHGTILVITDGKSYEVQPSREGKISPSSSSTNSNTENKKASLSENQPQDNKSNASEDNSKETDQNETTSSNKCGPGTVAINSASFEELQRIKHIGPDRANQIIEMRKTSPFTSYESLKRIKGIGDARAKDIEVQGIVCFD